MKLTKEEVEHVANLARLQLTKEEKEKFASQLSEILSYIDKLKKVNTDGLEATAQVTGLENVMREDSVQGCDDETREKLLAAAPTREEDYIKVKQVL